MTAPVFLANQLVPALSDIEVGQSCRLSGPEAHHAAAVIRLEIGESYDLVDGQGRRVSCRVTATSKTELIGEATAVVVEPVPVPLLGLVQGLAKGGRDEQAVEAAVEIGVDKVIPWQADRSISRWSGPKIAKGQQKWENLAQAAAKQSRRAFWPTVANVANTKELAALIAEKETEILALILHEEAASPLVTALEDYARETSPAEIWVIVGPEGGISADEVALLREAGAHPVKLGANILRSAHAGPAALAVLTAQLGRWSNR